MTGINCCMLVFVSWVSTNSFSQSDAGKENEIVAFHLIVQEVGSFGVFVWARQAQLNVFF
jgi:hypothetical protein